MSHTRIMRLAIRVHTVAVHGVCTTPHGSNWSAPMDHVCMTGGQMINTHVAQSGYIRDLFVWDAHGV